MSEEILRSPLNPTGETFTAQRGLARGDVADTLHWLERLTANPDFQRYLEFIQTGITAVGAAAQNIDQHDAAKRDAYAQRYFGMKSMAEWPAKQLASSKATLKGMDESGV